MLSCLDVNYSYSLLSLFISRLFLSSFSFSSVLFTYLLNKYFNLCMREKKKKKLDVTIEMVINEP